MNELSGIGRITKALQTAKTLHCGVSEYVIELVGHIESLEESANLLRVELAEAQARLTSFEGGFDPKAKKPKHISDLEDEIVVFQDKMGKPYIGVFDVCINKWCCITATQIMFTTDAIKRWFPLPGSREKK